MAHKHKNLPIRKKTYKERLFDIYYTISSYIPLKSFQRVWSYVEPLPLMIFREVATLYSRLTGWGFLVKEWALHSAFLFSANWIIRQLDHHLDTLVSPVVKAFFNMEENIAKDKEAGNMNEWNKFADGFQAIFAPLAYVVMGHIMVKFVNHYMQVRMSSHIHTALEDRLFAKEALLSSSRQPHLQKHLSSLSHDTSIAADQFSYLYTNAFSTIQLGLMSVNSLWSYSTMVVIPGIRIPIPDLLGAVIGINVIFQGTLNALAQKSEYYNQKSIVQHRVTSDKMNADITHSKPFTQQRREAKRKEKHREERIKSTTDWSKGQYIKHVADSLLMVKSIVMNLFQWRVIGAKVYDGAIPFSEHRTVFGYMDSFASLIGWSSDNMPGLHTLHTSKEHITRFLEHTDTLQTYQGPRLKREITPNMPKMEMLKLQKVSLRTDDRLLFNTNLTFKQGQRYLLTGKSGGGKSSLLSKIVGLDHDGIQASGTMSMRQGITIQMVSQEDYYPPHTTLLDILMLPNSGVPYNRVSFKQELEAMLKRMSAHNMLTPLELEDILAKMNKEEESASHDAHPWNKILSGGQKKKMILAAICIIKPDILLLDEAFNGLDIEAVKQIQDLIKTLLPKTTIICVDHHGEDHHKLSDFYDHHLELVSGEFMEKEIAKTQKRGNTILGK